MVNAASVKPIRKDTAIGDTPDQHLRRWSKAIATFQTKFHYSRAKVEQFELYCQQTSTLQLLIPLILPIIVPVIGLFLYMCIPLSPPSEGLLANRGFLAHIVILGVVCGVQCTEVFRQLLPPLTLRILDQLIMPISMTTYFSAFVIAFNFIFGFPVPFTTVVGGSPACVLGLVTFYLVMLRREGRREELVSGMECIALFTFTYVMYTAIAVSYTQFAQSDLKFLPILFLPLAKFIVRHAIKFIIKWWQSEFILTASVFMSKFFHVFYTSVLLQKSVEESRSTALLLSFDLIENLYTIGKMYKNITLVQGRARYNSHAKYKLDIFNIATQDIDREARALSLRLLYQAEMLLLTEYVEMVVPGMYATYLTFIRYLPNRQYINGVRAEEMTEDMYIASIKSLIAYSVVEFGLFLMVLFILQSNMRFPVLRQVCFAIHYQLRFILVLLSTWILFAIMGEEEHMGLDFSFQFKWLQRS